MVGSPWIAALHSSCLIERKAITNANTVEIGTTYGS